MLAPNQLKRGEACSLQVMVVGIYGIKRCWILQFENYFRLAVESRRKRSINLRFNKLDFENTVI